MPTFESFHGIHDGGTIVVCGCGSSLNDLPHPDRFITIGVNDVGRRFDPTYLVVVNPRSQFRSERFRYVEQSRARHVFTHLELGLAHPGVVRFRLGTFAGTSFDDPRVLHYTRNSPYVALCLAVHMGARRIGLIGVDFTDHHFFGDTGRHALTAHLDRIDEEYRRLGEAAARRGVEVVNLSPVSRLTAFPRAELRTWVRDAAPARPATAAQPAPRVFCVTYRFLACGDVFTSGLRRAAAELGVHWADASWDAADLPARVASFAPDLLFVVHGRRFVQRWGSAFDRYPSAVWLVDEPYEVDDTATFSPRFQHVFVNDPATLGCHRNARYLPLCYDPAAHYASAAPKQHDVGFVGGANPTRERMLAALAARGRLSYVVGGPWRHQALQRLCRARTIPAAETAHLYRSTRIVINIFRDLHHFNARGIAPTSMNPRIYEALACGALVVSQSRPEIAEIVPELPVFDDEAGLITLVERYLDDPEAREATRRACLARLHAGTYAERFRQVLSVVWPDGPPARQEERPMTEAPEAVAAIPEGWEVCGPVETRESDGALMLSATTPPRPGSERGIVTAGPHADRMLSFRVFVPSEACFVAKINQASKEDQQANSYHLYCDGGTAFLARHHCVFKALHVPRDTWVSLRLAYDGGRLSLYESDRLLHSVRDVLLTGGYIFLGVKRGYVLLRDVRLGPPPKEGAGTVAVPADFDVVVPPAPALRPRVSIVTTVFDRVECLADCIRSVRRQDFHDYEHAIVSDCPPPAVVHRIAALVQSLGDARVSYANLRQRHNNWGITPAAVGLRQARGEYIAFLSDDNGYTPQHVGMLVKALDANRSLGFVYSSCRYAGRLTLRHPVPAPARIDLGQPLFRRELFAAHLGDDLPFHMMAWDWALIDTLLKRGVRWKHIDVPSFVFRLAQYPQLREPA